jgi:hypothetical protein
MKRMVFSLGVVRIPDQRRYPYIGAWDALGLKICEGPVLGVLFRVARFAWCGSTD